MPFRILLAILYLAIGLLLSYPIHFSSDWNKVFFFIPGDRVDVRFNQYLLEHVYQSFLCGQSLWNPTFFYPVKNVFAYSDLFLSIAPIYFIFRTMGFFQDTSFQLLTLALLSLNFISVYVVLRHFKTSILGRLTAAYLFAFCGMRMVHLCHTQLLTQFFTILSLDALVSSVRFHLDRNSRMASLFLYLSSILFSLQFYGGYYLGWFYLFGLIIGCIILISKTETRAFFTTFLTHYWRSITGSILLSAVLLTPLYYHYQLALNELGYRSWSEVIPNLPEIVSWFNLGTSNWIYGKFYTSSPWNRLNFFKEHCLFLGWFSSLVTGIGLWMCRKDSIARTLILFVFVIGVLTTQTHGFFFGHEIWELVFYFFPGAQAIRGVSRMSFILLIPASFGVASFFSKSRIASKWKVIASIVILLEQVTVHPLNDKYLERQTIASLVNKIPKSCKAFFYSALSSTRTPAEVHLDAMMASLNNHIPTLNGFSGNNSRTWFFWFITAPFGRSQLEAALDAWSQEYGISFAKDCWIND